MFRSKARLLSAAIMLNLLALTPTNAQSTIPAEQIAKLESAVAATMADKHIPGLSIALVTDNKIAWQKAYGLSDIENSIPTRTETVFRLASVSKAITAVAAMQLVEKGKLDLDAPVQKYAPTFPTKEFPITTRQVLAHLSGIHHYKRGEPERTDRFERLTDALAIFKDDPLLHQPGANYTYTTFGYTLLGVIIEGASGMTYSDYLKEHVFKPAGMQHSYIDDVYAIIPNRGRGYTPRVYARFDGNVRNPALMDSSYKTPGGGLAMTAEDLARFAIATQNGVLIKPETFAVMSKMQKTNDGRETGYGYGWYVGSIGNRKVVSHGGVQAGTTTQLYLIPEKRFAVVILTNLEGGGALRLDALFTQVADILGV